MVLLPVKTLQQMKVFGQVGRALVRESSDMQNTIELVLHVFRRVLRLIRVN